MLETPHHRDVIVYQTSDGECPFDEWLTSLRDSRAVDKIILRIRRVEQGNLGDYKSVGKGVCELRIDYGGGYRIYFGQIGNTIVVLLGGGDKTDRERDILKAHQYWEDYRS